MSESIGNGGASLTSASLQQQKQAADKYKASATVVALIMPSEARNFEGVKHVYTPDAFLAFITTIDIGQSCSGKVRA